jgi:hypothetical protein
MADDDSELKRGLDDLGKAAQGLAGRLLGPRFDEREDPERPAVNPEIDDAVQELGDTVGHWLRSAGEGLQEEPDKLGKALDRTMDLAKDEVKHEPDAQGWSPLAQGARVFSEGLGAVAGQLFDRVADQAAGPSRHAHGEE